MHLAQMNVGHLAHPQDSPALAEFVDALDKVNKLAEQSPGFVWRMETEGDDPVLHVPGDPHLAYTMSVWESREDLWNFIYRSEHLPYLRRRKEWFRHVREHTVVLWWIPEGEIPTLVEARHRLDTLRRDGATREAFTFKEFYEPVPDSA